MDIKDRLSIFLDSLDISMKEIERQIGVKENRLQSVLKRSGSHLKSDLLIKIFTKYPQLSLDWLFLGLGDMYRQEYILAEENNQEIGYESVMNLIDKLCSESDKERNERLELEAELKNLYLSYSKLKTKVLTIAHLTKI